MYFNRKKTFRDSNGGKKVTVLKGRGFGSKMSTKTVLSELSVIRCEYKQNQLKVEEIMYGFKFRNARDT